MSRFRSFHFTFLLFGLSCWASIADVAAGELTVYPDVPGLDPSPHYLFRVRVAGSDAPWLESFAFVTRCKKGVPGENAYFPSLNGWTNSYTNFEMHEAAIEVEIRKADGTAIAKAVPHPRGKASSCELRDGRAYVTIEKPCLIAVDIEGQMDDQDTGKTPSGKYSGPPIHTVTVFANPPIEARPEHGEGVHVVKPGEQAPVDCNWKTLCFAPGVHDIGVGFPPKS